MARKVFLYVFAFIGILAIVFFMIKTFKETSGAKNYSKHCKEIKEGMSLEKTRLIMGDGNPGDHVGEIEISHGTGSTPEFYLHYPAGGASTGPSIYFDPRTLIVTKIYCGD